MPTYFKPLRRKIGVVTLVLECVFAAGWVRSAISLDLVYFPLARCVLISGGQKFYVIRNRCIYYHLRRTHVGDDFEIKLVPIDWDPATPFNTHSLRAPEHIGLFSSENGLEWSEKDIRPIVEMIPYWSIVLPLTLLSAWLLLSRPRTKTEP